MEMGGWRGQAGDTGSRSTRQPLATGLQGSAGAGGGGGRWVGMQRVHAAPPGSPPGSILTARGEEHLLTACSQAFSLQHLLCAGRI